MRLLNNGIYLKVPTVEELKYTEELLSCKETMSFNNKWGGVVPFPMERWGSFHDGYCKEYNTNRYFHIYNLDNMFVGEVSIRYDVGYEKHVLNIKVKHELRGNNHGYDALCCFLDYLFDKKEYLCIIDDVGIDNVGALNLLKRIGFIEQKRTKEIILLEMKKEDWL